jgi:hypothetical protein
MIAPSPEGLEKAGLMPAFSFLQSRFNNQQQRIFQLQW